MSNNRPNPTTPNSGMKRTRTILSPVAEIDPTIPTTTPAAAVSPVEYVDAETPGPKRQRIGSPDDTIKSPEAPDTDEPDTESSTTQGLDKGSAQNKRAGKVSRSTQLIASLIADHKADEKLITSRLSQEEFVKYQNELTNKYTEFFKNNFKGMDGYKILAILTSISQQKIINKDIFEANLTYTPLTFAVKYKNKFFISTLIDYLVENKIFNRHEELPLEESKARWALTLFCIFVTNNPTLSKSARCINGVYYKREPVREFARYFTLMQSIDLTKKTFYFNQSINEMLADVTDSKAKTEMLELILDSQATIAESSKKFLTDYILLQNESFNSNKQTVNFTPEKITLEIKIQTDKYRTQDKFNFILNLINESNIAKPIALTLLKQIQSDQSIEDRLKLISTYIHAGMPSQIIGFCEKHSNHPTIKEHLKSIDIKRFIKNVDWSNITDALSAFKLIDLLPPTKENFIETLKVCNNFTNIPGAVLIAFGTTITELNKTNLLFAQNNKLNPTETEQLLKDIILSPTFPMILPSLLKTTRLDSNQFFNAVANTIVNIYTETNALILANFLIENLTFITNFSPLFIAILKAISRPEKINLLQWMVNLFTHPKIKPKMVAQNLGHYLVNLFFPEPTNPYRFDFFKAVLPMFGVAINSKVLNLYGTASTIFDGIAEHQARHPQSQRYNADVAFFLEKDDTRQLMQEAIENANLRAIQNPRDAKQPQQAPALRNDTQSTHNKYVHKTTSASAIKLYDRYLKNLNPQQVQYQMSLAKIQIDNEVFSRLRKKIEPLVLERFKTEYGLQEHEAYKEASAWLLSFITHISPVDSFLTGAKNIALDIQKDNLSQFTFYTELQKNKVLEDYILALTKSYKNIPFISRLEEISAYHQTLQTADHIDPESKIHLSALRTCVWMAINDNKFFKPEETLKLINIYFKALAKMANEYGHGDPSCTGGQFNSLVEVLDKSGHPDVEIIQFSGPILHETICGTGSTQFKMLPDEQRLALLKSIKQSENESAEFLQFKNRVIEIVKQEFISRKIPQAEINKLCETWTQGLTHVYFEAIQLELDMINFFEKYFLEQPMLFLNEMIQQYKNDGDKAVLTDRFIQSAKVEFIKSLQTGKEPAEAKIILHLVNDRLNARYKPYLPVYLNMFPQIKVLVSEEIQRQHDYALMHYQHVAFFPPTGPGPSAPAPGNAPDSPKKK